MFFLKCSRFSDTFQVKVSFASLLGQETVQLMMFKPINLTTGWLEAAARRERCTVRREQMFPNF